MVGFDFFIVIFALLAAVVAFVLLIVFVMVPLFRGVGAFIAACFHATAWFFRHIFEFIGGMIGDSLRFVGALLAMVVLSPLSVVNVIIGRWSAAAHFADSVKREFMVAGACLYRVLIRRPLKLLWLHGLLEGLEERVPEAVYATPGSDKPRDRTMQFDGYTIVGSLAGGGSGGKLYIARPDDPKRVKLVGRPEHVVIKSFAISEGSSLPQIVRESRALECAKQLGHVLDHGMDDHRFFYVMPYHPGDHLGIITRQLHGEADGALGKGQLSQVTGYISDLLATLSLYHEGGLWHKDVKPENVIVHDGRAHLVDLGLVTPLKSAMTLTTHGTEYFRDPEMVRQALRGVKVHQVDGAKFDIYAVGAVLYYMIENTFPAHGGLSRFSKKSPEALRWIVRRAMAEYNQRYTSAAMMLGDVAAVARAQDPFAFKPADLPSMRSGDQSAEDVDVEIDSPQAAQVHAAGSPQPREEGRAWGVGVGIGENGPFAKAGAFGGGGGGESDKSETAALRRPLLRITNWWTGAYAVDDDGKGGRGTPVAPPAPRVPVTGRRTAREQLANARARARELQQRAVSRRHKVGLERQPSPMLGFLVIVFLVIVALVAIPFVSRERVATVEVSSTTPVPVAGSSASEDLHPGKPLLVLLEGGPVSGPAAPAVQAVIERYENRGYNVLTNAGLPMQRAFDLYDDWQQDGSNQVTTRFEDVLAEHDLYGFLHIKVVTGDDDSPKVSETLIRSGRSDADKRKRPRESDATLAAAPTLPFILINDHPAKTDQRVVQRVAEILNQYGARGWQIDIDDEAEAAARKAMPAAITPNVQLSPRLEQILHERGLGGVLYIDARPGDGEPQDRVRVIEIPVSESHAESL